MPSAASKLLRRPLLVALFALCTAGQAANASAGEFEVENALGTYPVEFSITGGATKLATAGNGGFITCTSSTAKGKYTSATTGEVQLSFHGCTWVGFPGYPCTTSGQLSGTIVSSTRVFHNVYLEPDRSKLGLLITGPGTSEFEKTPLMTFVCAGVLYTVGGSVIGELVKPGCGKTSKELSVLYEKKAESTEQRWRLITTGPDRYYEMFTKRSGMGFVEGLVLQGTLTGSFSEAITVTCP
jgi:hypothetical protein